MDQINSGYEPRTLYGGSALFADGDAYRPVDGDVSLPERVRATIRTRPLVGRILEVHLLPKRTFRGDTLCRKEFAVRLSVVGGTPKLGDEFHPTFPDGAEVEVRVRQIDAAGIAAVATAYQVPCEGLLGAPDRSWVLETHVFDPVKANRRIEKERLEDADANRSK